MFGLNESTQYYVCQRYVHKWLVSDSENRDGTSATWRCGIYLLLQEPPAGENAQMGWRRFPAVPEATGARNL